MNSFGDAWELVCSYCKSKITDVAYNTWIVRIKPLDLDFDGNTAYLLVPNDFHRQTITRCYIPLLNEAFEAIFDNKFKLELKTPDEIGEKNHTEKKAEETGNNYELSNGTIIKKLTADDVKTCSYTKNGNQIEIQNCIRITLTASKNGSEHKLSFIIFPAI